MRTTLCCGLLWMVGCAEATAPEDGVEAPPQAVDADLEPPSMVRAVNVTYGSGSWVEAADTWVTERWVTTGNCDRSLEYFHGIPSLAGPEGSRWVSVLVPAEVEGGGPFPMPAPGTDPTGYSDLVHYDPALGVGAWISGGTVTVVGADGAGPGGLRFDGGEACTATGCSPMPFPLEFSMVEPWPESSLNETDADRGWFSGVDGPGGLPLCP